MHAKQSVFPMTVGVQAKSSPVSSMMSCNEVADQQESQYFYLLEGSGAYEIKGDVLTLKDATGQKTIEYKSGN